MSYTKQVSHQTKIIKKQTFILVFMKIAFKLRYVKHNHISKQNFEHILGNFVNPQIVQPKF